MRSGPIRHKKKAAEGLLENISLLTKIKRRKGNGLFPLDVFEMLGNAATSLGPQSRL